MNFQELFYRKKFLYDAERYRGTFLYNNPYCNPQESVVEPVIYCFWTGDNEMSQMRDSCFRVMQTNLEVPVKLITPRNLDQYILKEYPLHRAFENLSLVHKSDYLRCYFMHHYGGGYTDIKWHDKSWTAVFKQFNQSDAWVMGYREIGARGVAPVGGLLGQDLKRHWRLLIGNCSYICRPGTPFTHQWYAELHERMDMYEDQLAAHPGNIMGDNEGYPIPWTNILGDIFHPLCLKYNSRILFSEDIKPNFKTSYR